MRGARGNSPTASEVPASSSLETCNIDLSFREEPIKEHPGAASQILTPAGVATKTSAGSAAAVKCCCSLGALMGAVFVWALPPELMEGCQSLVYVYGSHDDEFHDLGEESNIDISRGPLTLRSPLF
jgi:hypothetical protein